MIAPTHATFAGFVYLLLLTTSGVALSFINAAIVVFASILPDIDTGGSIVGKALPFISRRIEQRFGHRTLTHSIPGMAGIAILISPLLLVDKDWFICLCVGYATHPFLDSMTVNGVRMFYPFSSLRCVFPLEVNSPRRYRVLTGSRMDKALCIIFLLACLPTYYVAQQGYERFIRFAQRNIESAVRDYNEFSQTHLVRAHITAHNMLTRERIAGEYEIIGSLDDHTLLFRGKDGQLHSLGKEYQADFVAGEVLCEKGEPSATLVTTIDMVNQPLSQLRSYLDPGREHHLFGLLNVNEPVAVPRETREFMTISGTGTTLRFHFASYADIHRMNLENALISRGILTIRSSVSGELPGDTSMVNPASFHTISTELGPGETMGYQCNIGDTVALHGVLARKAVSGSFQEQIDLNNSRIAALQREGVAVIASLMQRLAESELRARRDSSEYFQQQQLHRDGFVATGTVAKAERVCAVSGGEVEVLRRSLRTIEDKTELQVRNLHLRNSALAEKEFLAVSESVLVSPVEGVVIDIRTIHKKEKTRITYVIRKLDASVH